MALVVEQISFGSSVQLPLLQLAASQIEATASTTLLVLVFLRLAVRMELLQLLLGSARQQVRMRVQDLREELPRKIEPAAAPGDAIQVPKPS